LYTLVTRRQPVPSPSGMTWLAATVVAMVALATGKRRTGAALRNPVLIGEARVTMVDEYLAASVLVGLTLNALFGWWWADPLSASRIVYYGLREWHHIRAETRMSQRI
jgi:divalent metal cation (Fe/Co/Zn/Cd) transporter